MTDLAKYRPKLAELCGWEYRSEAFIPFYRKGSDGMSTELWRPDEDVGQAIQVLEALAAKGWRWAIESWLRYDIQLQPPDAPNDWTRHLSDDGPLPTAIITTVVRAMEWE